jgi:site-specific recombinase XerD
MLKGKKETTLNLEYMKNKIVTHFYVKESKKNDKGHAPIYLRITINGERAEISIDRKINPAEWDRLAERVSGRSEVARTINAYLTTCLGKVEKYFSSLDTRDERISVKQIISELKGKGSSQVTLLQIYESHIRDMENLINADFAPNTIKRYKSSLNGLSEFISKVQNRYDIRLIDLNNSFIESYYTFLRTNKGLKQNSAAKDIKNLLRVINKAVTNKLIQNNPFKGFSCNYKDAQRGYLTEEEIETIYKKSLSIRRLEQVRDTFIFQIYTGLSYIDMSELTDNNIQTGINGGKWIVVNRKKTGIRSSIPILPRAQEVLEKYKEDPVCSNKGKRLPVCSNQRMNGYLKELADLCEIKKTLSTHLARHTFATTVTLTKGIPMETVSKMLGHTSLKTTQIYSKVVDRKVADDMKILLEKKPEQKVASSDG